MLEFLYLIHLNIILLFSCRDSWGNLYPLEIKICDENMLFIGDITTTGGIERVLSILTTEQLKDSEFDITIVSQFHSHLTPNYFFDNNVKIVYLSEKKFDGAPGSLTRFIHHFEMIGKVRKFFMRNRFDLITFSIIS